MIEKVSVSVKSSLEKVQALLLDQRTSGGYWEGELSASALSTATAVTTLSFYLQANPDSTATKKIETQIESGLRWLVEMQNEDGGWGDTSLNYSNISTSMLVLASLHAAEACERFNDAKTGLEKYIEDLGGVDAVRRRYGDDKTFAVPILANCAMAGMIDWSEVSPLPFEAACVPQRFYHLMNLPVVSYAVPALVAIGQAKFHFDPPRNPIVRTIRKMSVERSLKVLQRMQPESGGFLEAIPLTSFVCMALIKIGRHDHPVVQRGIEFLLDSFRADENETGTWPIDTNLANWVTTLAINGLANDDTFEFRSEEDWSKCLDWILNCQYKEVHPFTGAAPGGWGWTNLTGSVPDADDTPGALLAIRAIRERGSVTDSDAARIAEAAENGVVWLLGLQNRDGGWPTFCRGWGRLPFDRSGTDLTAHAIRALELWKGESKHKSRVEAAILRGFSYLEKNQHADGYWLPLWFGNQDKADDINPFYGTAKVIHAYSQCKRLHTKSAQNGLKWIQQNQNHDGGWGGGTSVVRTNNELGISSVEETALCTESLLLDESPQSQAVAAEGVRWLERAVESDAVSQCTPIGFYFAKLWYYEKLYPLIYATAALGSANRTQTADRQREEKLDSVNR